jgi:ubiquinone/menaquinone biosynthesis C-methylase UbiE
LPHIELVIKNPTERFSSRVENYIKYRPTYPRSIINLLTSDCNLTKDSVIADVGSGTGILSQLFLQNGNRVFGIEPNIEMRNAGDRLLNHFRRFTSVAGTAEATTLDDHSVHMFAAGQAFHWFDREKARAEFARILKPNGWVVLVWNDRRTNSSAFLKAYERLLSDYGTDYKEVDHKRINKEAIRVFFGSERFKTMTFENSQVLDFEGTKGRILSSSYVPEVGHPAYDAMLEELRSIFKIHEVGGKVSFQYDTRVYFGHLSPANENSMCTKKAPNFSS